MAVLAGPRSLALLIVHHHRVDVIFRTEVLACPFNLTKLLVGWVTGVKAAARPFSNELFCLDWLQFVEYGGDFGFLHLTRLLLELIEFFLRTIRVRLLDIKYEDIPETYNVRLSHGDEFDFC